MKQLNLLLLLLGLTFSLLAQQARQYSFTQYTTADGLASNHVNAVGQDKKGYIWLATTNGLNRFDGRDFLTFKHDPRNPNSLLSNNIGTMFCDSKGRIWILDENNRTGLFDGERFAFKEFPVDMPFDRFNLYNYSFFREDWDGRIYLFMTGRGVYELDETAQRFKLVDQKFGVPAGWTVLYFQPDLERKLYWFGCDSGMVKYEPHLNRVSRPGANASKDPVIDAFADLKNVQGIQPIRGSRSMLVYHWPRKHPTPFLYWYDGETGKKIRHAIGPQIPRSYHEYRGSTQQSNGSIWLFGLPFIAEFDTAKQSFQFVHQSAPFSEQFRFDVGHQLFEDREHNYWLATSDGLFLFNPSAQAFNAYYLLRPGQKNVQDGPVEHVRQMKNGQIWVGTWGIGFYIYDSLFQPLKVPSVFDPYKDNMLLWYIHEHSKTGLIFMGEQTGYLKVYNPATGKLISSQPPIFRERTIRQMAEDREGNIWFGTQGGRLIKWDYKASGGDPTRGFELVHELGLIQKLFIDWDGTLWVATLGWGTYHIDPATGHILHHITKETASWKTGNDSPTDIIRYNDSLLLLATNNITVLNTRTMTSRLVSSDDGLPSNSAYFLQMDKRGMVWIGMQNGLCRWNLPNNNFTVFDRRDGIQFDNFTSGGAFRIKDSLLAFTTTHNFLVFDPDKAMRGTLPPKVTITGMQILNQRVNYDSVMRAGKLELNHRNNSIMIDYSSLQYMEHGQLTYYHKLEGLDDNWVKSTRNQAIYNYLPYRNFTFQVKAVNGDGEESAYLTSLVIQVKPPFWRSYWFMAMMVFILISFLYWLDRLRMQKIRATESIRNRIAASLSQDLTNSLNSINISSELAKTKIEQDALRTRDYIHHISETSNRMTQAMNDMVWSIDPQNDQMSRTLEKMKQFALEQELMHDITITIDADPAIADKHSDMEHRYELLSIFKEAVGNAVKHSHARNIQVQLRLRKKKLQMIIQDDGKGFELSYVVKGRGIQDMQRRADAIGADFEILSEKNTGTVVRLETKLRS
ncbi:MAG TPA: two-component regulator propeller domain-containing protein [Flavihumibacter sp.]